MKLNMFERYLNKVKKLFIYTFVKTFKACLIDNVLVTINYR